MNYCQKKCFGEDNYDGSCCCVEQRNYIMGPIPDSYEVLEKVKKKYPGVSIEWSDIFMTFEEGSKLFPDKETWQNKSSYPCMRVNPNSSRNSCVFYNDIVGFCQIYDERSTTCSNYKCDFLREMEKNTNV